MTASLNKNAETVTSRGLSSSPFDFLVEFITRYRMYRNTAIELEVYLYHNVGKNWLHFQTFCNGVRIMLPLVQHASHFQFVAHHAKTVDYENEKISRTHQRHIYTAIFKTTRI
jgi:hypothetical protein